MRTIKTILLVDDDPSANLSHKNIIENSGFAREIVLRDNGKAAFDYLEACMSGSFPELVLLDLNMPVMDGFEFLDRFEQLCQRRSDKATVVILTKSRNADDHLRLIGMGNYHIIAKPFDEIKLTDIRHRYFRE